MIPLEIEVEPKAEDIALSEAFCGPEMPMVEVLSWACIFAAIRAERGGVGVFVIPQRRPGAEH